MNWKAKAAESIVNHAPVAPAGNSDCDLAVQLDAALHAGKIAARDQDFARSLIAGFNRHTSFTDKQRPHVARLIAGPAPQDDTELELAERLQAALDGMNARDYAFASSLLEGFARYGRFTDRQRPYAEKLAAGSAPAPISSPAPAPAASPTFPNLCGVVNLDRFARFTVGPIKLSLKNDGSAIWCKRGDTLFGVIDTATQGFRKLSRGLSPDGIEVSLADLKRIEADPLAAAKADGILTGRCSCCGRPLTDPQSIAIGIGPVCLGKFG